MKKLKKTTPLLLTTVFVALLAIACQKDNSSPDGKGAAPTPYYVRMTDAPALYSAVNIDLQSVIITGANGGAITLNTNAGIYNLLNFSNGVDTLIATGSLTTSRVQQIRLVLGPNNSVVVNGNTYPLAVPSGEESGLKLQVHQELVAGVGYEVLLDFDANQSIVDQGNGTYSLKPVIRTVETALTGSIKGKISPFGFMAVVTATLGSNIYTTTVDSNGEFIIAGLPPGSYSLNVTPVSPYSPVNVLNVIVTIGATTNVGTLNV